MKEAFRDYFVIIIFAFFFCFSLNAKEASDEASENQSCICWFSKDKHNFSIQAACALPLKGDVRNPAPAEELIFAADFDQLRFDSGLKLQSEQLDLTNRLFYMPTFFNSFQTGLGINWHFYRYIDTFTENDLTLLLGFRWFKGPVFTFENAAGLLFKFTSIDAVKEYRPLFFNLSYQLEFLFNWYLLDCMNLWVNVKLQDYFDYPLALSPFAKFGFNIWASPELNLGFDFTLKFVDMFYSAVYLNENILRFTVKVVL